MNRFLYRKIFDENIHISDVSNPLILFCNIFQFNICQKIIDYPGCIQIVYKIMWNHVW